MHCNSIVVVEGMMDSWWGEYENFVNTHLEAAAECIPTKELNLESHGIH